MKEQGFIIYPGKLTVVDSFRIGCIGQVDASVMQRVTKACAGRALGKAIGRRLRGAIGCGLQERGALAAMA